MNAIFDSTPVTYILLHTNFAHFIKTYDVILANNVYALMIDLFPLIDPVVSGSQTYMEMYNLCLLRKR